MHAVSVTPVCFFILYCGRVVEYARRTTQRGTWKQFHISKILYRPQQHGAAEARRAHNPEVPRSKRGIAIIFFRITYVPTTLEYVIKFLSGRVRPEWVMATTVLLHI